MPSTREDPGGREQQPPGEPVPRVQRRVPGLAATPGGGGEGLQRHLGLGHAADLSQGRQQAGTPRTGSDWLTGGYTVVTPMHSLPVAFCVIV